jgi:hypothetical protein
MYSISKKTNKFGISPIAKDAKLGLIKVCVEPTCEALWHNCPTEIKKCADCGGSIKMINQETYFKKFAFRFFQYDQPSGDFFRPKIVDNCFK